MKILVNLGSALLSEALCRLIEELDENFVCRIADRLPDPSDFEPHMVLVDVCRLGLERKARWRQAKTVLIDSGLRDQEMAGLLVYHNLDGIIATGTDATLLRKALQTIARGELWIDHRQIKCLMRNTSALNRRDAFASLTDKERQIIGFVSEGLKNREIAAKLFLSEQTIKAHVSHIYKKLQVSNRSQLVSLVTKHPITDD